MNKVAVNFDLQNVVSNFENKLKQTSDSQWLECLKDAIDKLTLEFWGVYRYDKQFKELIFINLDSGLTKPQGCFDSENLPKLFDDFISVDTIENNYNSDLHSISPSLMERIKTDLNRILEEQIELAKLKIKPAHWTEDRKSKYTIRRDSDWKDFIKRTLNIAHEETWLVLDDNGEITSDIMDTAYYGHLNWYEITFEAQTRAC
jgi:hypothetical protein